MYFKFSECIRLNIQKNYRPKGWRKNIFHEKICKSVDTLVTLHLLTLTLVFIMLHFNITLIKIKYFCMVVDHCPLTDADSCSLCHCEGMHKPSLHWSTHAIDDWMLSDSGRCWGTWGSRGTWEDGEGLRRLRLRLLTFSPKGWCEVVCTLWTFQSISGTVI